MKNRIILSLLAIAAVSFVPIESTAQKKTMTITAADDTLVNAATGYATLTTAGPKASASFQLVVTKIDGTVAGTATLEGSHDGTNWASVSASSFTLTNVASQNFIWTAGPSTVPYYRIKWVGSGTQRCIPTATAVLR